MKDLLDKLLVKLSAPETLVDVIFTSLLWIAGAIVCAIIYFLLRRIGVRVPTRNDTIKLLKRIVRRIIGPPPAKPLGRIVSLEKAKETERDTSKHKRFFVVDKETRLAYEYLPDNLKDSEVVWELPDEVFDLSVEERRGGAVNSIQLLLDFIADHNFASWVRKKKKLTKDDLRQIIVEKWFALPEAKRDRESLNDRLEAYGLRCTKLQFYVAEKVINQENFVFLKVNNIWQCWQDSRQFSAQKDRFTPRQDLDMFLPQKVVNVPTEKYVVQLGAKRMFFTFGKVITFGRSSTRSIYLYLAEHPASDQISRDHCTLKGEDGKFLLVNDSTTKEMMCDGNRLGSGESLKFQKRHFQLQFPRFLRLSAVFREFEQTEFACLWRQQNLPLEAFFKLCGRDSSDINAQCICFAHLDNTIDSIANPLKDEEYYAVQI